MSDRDYSNTAAPDIPNRLVVSHTNPPTLEYVRKNKANLTNSFAVLREWRAKENLRPPPCTLQFVKQQTDPLRLSGEQSLHPNQA